MITIQYFFIIICFLILLGCGDEELDEVEEPSPDDQANELTALSPFNFGLNSSSSGINMMSDKYCWDTDENECDLTPTEPEELLEGISLYLEADAETTISLNTEGQPDTRTIDLDFFPDELTLIQTTASTGEKQEIELNDMQFTPIKEKGLIHYYTLIAKWDNEELTGEAIYGARVHVRD